MSYGPTVLVLFIPEGNAPSDGTGLPLIRGVLVITFRVTVGEVTVLRTAAVTESTPLVTQL
jgi:hypothetical protein